MNISSDDITGIVLAGGRGSRMGGVDKGLQNFRGFPLGLHACLRMRPQVAHLMINANRNLSAYESFGVEVWPDALPDYAGPLAGFLTGLEHCDTPWLAVCPVDSPLFPTDWVQTLASAIDGIDGQADIAVVSAPEASSDGSVTLRPQPVFCLLRASLMEDLIAYTHSGGRKIDAWTARHCVIHVPFDSAQHAQAFCNVNTLDELQALE